MVVTHTVVLHKGFALCRRVQLLWSSLLCWQSGHLALLLVNRTAFCQRVLSTLNFGMAL